MAVNLRATLARALRGLQTERARLDRQIAALQTALASLGGRTRSAAAPRPRRPKRMSAAARRAISARMKAYWAKRKAAARRAK